MGHKEVDLKRDMKEKSRRESDIHERTKEKQEIGTRTRVK